MPLTHWKADDGAALESMGAVTAPPLSGAGRAGLFDRNLPLLLARAGHLLTHGVFHLKLHFHGEQMTCWWFNDPLRYRVYRGQEVFAESVMDKCSDDSNIVGLLISDDDVAAVLWGFQQLRQLKGEDYLRSASVNRVNGMLGLSFDCDRIHYLQHLEFPAFLVRYGITL